ATMNPDAIADLGFWFALTPVPLGTVVRVLIAIAYARLTGKRYPFRHFDDLNGHGTRDRDPVERFGLSEEELTTILERYSQSFNLGTEDLARSIGAAELQAATHKTGVATASDIMSKDMVTVTPDTDFASLFRHHRFTSLPVVGEGNRFFGTIFQIHLIDRAREDALRLHRGFLPAMMRLVDAKRDRPVRAKD
ncbi:CBS domain-containing protein, partial [Falsihalocynthiibacter sp. BN13B15]|uniref:CBS domain-containing protein n=1 Tax=Falsihalocynthiibacter sp. BN13B15 TaxID=3240871 RepID=UPI00350F6132